MLAEDTRILSYPWHPGNADLYFSCQSCWWLTLLGCLWPWDQLSLWLLITFSGNKSQWCQTKGYHRDWRRPCRVNSSEPFQWNLIKQSKQLYANLSVFPSLVLWLLKTGFLGALLLVISAGVDVVSHAAGSLIFSPLLTSFCWLLLDFARNRFISLGSKGTYWWWS